MAMEAENMVRCAQCGVHLPRSESYHVPGQFLLQRGALSSVHQARARVLMASPAGIEQPVSWEAEAAPSRGELAEPFWRSLFYFNVYRLLVALLLLMSVAVCGKTLVRLARPDAVYYRHRRLRAVQRRMLRADRHAPALQLAAWRAGRRRRRLHRDADALRQRRHFRAGSGCCCCPALAAAGLISRGRMTLFFRRAGQRSRVLLEQTYEVLLLRRSDDAVRAGRPAEHRLLRDRLAGPHAGALRWLRPSNWRRSAKSTSPTWRKSTSS